MQYLCQGPCKLEYGFLAQGWGWGVNETMVSLHLPPIQLISTVPSLPPPLQLEFGLLLGPEALKPREQLGPSAGHGQAPVPSTPRQAGSHRPGAVPDPRCSSETPQSSVGTEAEPQALIWTLLLAPVTTLQILGTLDCEQQPPERLGDRENLSNHNTSPHLWQWCGDVEHGLHGCLLAPDIQQ